MKRKDNIYFLRLWIFKINLWLGYYWQSIFDPLKPEIKGKLKIIRGLFNLIATSEKVHYKKGETRKASNLFSGNISFEKKFCWFSNSKSPYSSFIILLHLIWLKVQTFESNCSLNQLRLSLITFENFVNQVVPNSPRMRPNFIFINKWGRNWAYLWID